MFEGLTYLVSQELPIANENESKWIYDSFRVVELSRGVHRLADGEQMDLLESLMLLDDLGKEDTVIGLHVLTVPWVEQEERRGFKLPKISPMDGDSHISFGFILQCPSYIISTRMPVTCEQESKTTYRTFYAIRLSNGKCFPEDAEPIVLKRSSKVLDEFRKKEEPEVFRDLALHLEGRTWSQRLCKEQINTSSLIHHLGRDITANCLLHLSRSHYGSIASLNRGFRSLVRSGELYRLRRQMGIVEQWVYFSCNLIEWHAFDPSQCRWMSVPPMICNECFMCSDKESLAVGTDILVFGKGIDSNLVYKYSILTNSWTTGTKTNIPRCLFGSASCGEIAIVAGGCDSRGNILSSAEMYNSETETWFTLPSMSKGRKLCSGVFMDGKFYVIGGVGAGSSNALTSGEMYDLETKTWHEIPNMFPSQIGLSGYNDGPATSKAPPLLAVVKNELYAGYYTDLLVRKYDKVRNQWSTIANFPERATSMNGWGVAFRACEDQLIVVGGPRVVYGGTIEVYSLVPDETPLQWKLLGSKCSGNFVYNCAVMGC